MKQDKNIMKYRVKIFNLVLAFMVLLVGCIPPGTNTNSDNNKSDNFKVLSSYQCKLPTSIAISYVESTGPLYRPLYFTNPNLVGGGRSGFPFTSSNPVAKISFSMTVNTPLNSSTSNIPLIRFEHLENGIYIYKFSNVTINNIAALRNSGDQTTFTVPANFDCSFNPTINARFSTITYNAISGAISGTVKLIRGVPRDKLVFSFPVINPNANTCNGSQNVGFYLGDQFDSTKNLELTVPFTCGRDCPAGQALTGTPASCQPIVQPTPPPAPSTQTSFDDDTFPCNESIPANNLKSSGLNIQSFSSLNIGASLDELVEKVNEVNIFQAKIDSLDARINEKLANSQDASIEIAKKTDVQTEKQNAINELNNIKLDVTNGLTKYKNTLRDKANNLTQNPNYSVDDPNKPSDLQGYKDLVWDLDFDFSSLLSSGNTFEITQAISVLADENKLLIDLTNDYFSGLLTDIQPVTNTENFSDIEILNKSSQVVKFLSRQIDYHQNKLNTAIIKSQQVFEDSINNLIVAQIQRSGEFSDSSFQSLFESELLSPTTFELDLTKLAEDGGNAFFTQSFNDSSNMTFTTKDAFDDDKLALYVAVKQQVGGAIHIGAGHVKTAVNYLTQTETYKKYAKPIVDIIDKKISNPVPQATLQLAAQAHVAMNNFIKTHGTDKIATAIAKSKPGWKDLNPTQKEERVNRSKELLHDIVNIDTMALAGGAAIKTAANLAAFRSAIKAADAIDDAVIAQVQAERATLESLRNAATNKNPPFIKEVSKNIQKKLDYVNNQLKQKVNELKIAANRLCTSGKCSWLSYQSGNTLIPSSNTLDSLLGTSQTVGNFTGIKGKTIEEIVSKVPAGATRRKLTPKPGKVQDGFEYEWIDSVDGKAKKLRIHGPDLSRPKDGTSNAGSGWIAVVINNRKYQDDLGNLFKSNIFDPAKPATYNPIAANNVHIPIAGNPVLSP